MEGDQPATAADFASLRERVYALGRLVPTSIGDGNRTLLGYAVISLDAVIESAGMLETEINVSAQPRPEYRPPTDEQAGAVIVRHCERLAEEIVQAAWGVSEAFRCAADPPALYSSPDDAVEHAFARRNLRNNSFMGQALIRFLQLLELPSSLCMPARDLPDWALRQHPNRPVTSSEVGTPTIGHLLAGALAMGDGDTVERLVRHLKGESKTGRKPRDWETIDSVRTATQEELRMIRKGATPTEGMLSRFALFDQARGQPKGTFLSAVSERRVTPSAAADELVDYEYQVSRATRNRRRAARSSRKRK